MDQKFFSILLSLGIVLSTLFLFIPDLVAHEGPHLDQRKPVCLKEYPVDPSMFNGIVRPYVNQIIKKHGLEEWKAVLLTNEFHRHLGMWSIIGAKMGIRAREVLGAPFDQLDVISFCGNKPPFSCTNDGIQVSTGASLGRGTISITHLGLPEAIFIYDGKRLRLRVKPHVKVTIGKVIKELSAKYGFQSPEYFQALDEVSVKYWLEWDRGKIFDEISER
ncbi:formylmethanofuran dehydrogenase subunit E family protein [Thermodesulfobacteriota bacterium]